MKVSRLNDKERKELIAELCHSLLNFSDPVEMAEVLMDLLYPKEIETIAKRLKIAEFLARDLEYQEIRRNIKVGYSTIARVKTWLSLSGKGFASLLKRKRGFKKETASDDRYDPFSWSGIKRRYTLYYWPQLLIEELTKNADKKEKKRLGEVLNKIEEKAREFTSERNKELYKSFSSSLKC